MILNPWKKLREAQKEIENLNTTIRFFGNVIDSIQARQEFHFEALQKIADVENPKSSAVVKRIAAIAREALVK